MKKFCIIPMCPRTGSTYLNQFVQKYNDSNSINLSEFFNIFFVTNPRYFTHTNLNIKTKKILNNLPYENNKKYKILKKIWKKHWEVYSYFLTNEYKIEKLKLNKPMRSTSKYIMKKHLNIVLNSKQSLVFKIFPSTFFEYENIFKDFFKLAKNELQIIFLEREDILGVYLSAVYCSHFNLYNMFSEVHNKALTKNILCYENTHKWIFNNIRDFNIIKSRLKENDYKTIYFDKLWDEIDLTNKLELNYRKDNNKTTLPCKLYSKYNQEEKIKFIADINQFWGYYNAGIEILKKEHYENIAK
jgi:hypothetical protein